MPIMKKKKSLWMKMKKTKNIGKITKIIGVKKKIGVEKGKNKRTLKKY